MSQRAKLRALYAGLPTVECRGLCADACGPIAASALELRELRSRIPTAPPDGDRLACPLLRAGRCTAYGVRPLICRLYGVAEGLRCPHGCRPTRLLHDDEARELIEAAHAIGGASEVFRA